MGACSTRTAEYGSSSKDGSDNVAANPWAMDCRHSKAMRRASSEMARDALSITPTVLMFLTTPFGASFTGAAIHSAWSVLLGGGTGIRKNDAATTLCVQGLKDYRRKARFFEKPHSPQYVS